MREEDRPSDRPTTKLKFNQIVRIDIGSGHITNCSHFCEVVRDFDLAQQREVFLEFNEDDKDFYRDRWMFNKSVCEKFFDFLVENDFVRKIDVCFKYVML